MTVCIITLQVRLNENEITLCRKGKNRGLNNLRTLLPVFQYRNIVRIMRDAHTSQYNGVQLMELLKPLGTIVT